MISGKFAITIHILTLLAKYPESFMSSEHIAGSINLNPVLVRKEIANLKKHNLIESKEGKNGGARLSKAAANITLKEIFEITFGTIDLGFAKNIPNSNCPVGNQINQNLNHLYSGINDKISKELEVVTLENFSNQF